ncbi:MAG: peptidoglycan DD-metalloendopeptidase family protein [Actinomycetota bacterium]
MENRSLHSPEPCRRAGAIRGTTRSKLVRTALIAVVLLGAGALPAVGTSSTTTTTTTAPTSTTAAPTTESTTTTAAAPTSTTAAPTTASSAPTTAAPATSTTLSAAQQAERDSAASNLRTAQQTNSEIAAGLRSITEEAQGTQSKIDNAQRQLEVARSTMQTAAEELAESSTAQVEIEEQLRAKAIEGFKAGVGSPGPFFNDGDINQTIRQAELLSQANKGTAELLEELNTLLEDRRVARAEAEQAARDSEVLEQQLLEELENLRDQQLGQLELKAEAERRIARWEAELTAYAREDAAIRDLISDSSTDDDIAQPIPTQPSLLGYQWPVIGRLSSPYGYRIHPVYGTRKLHAGVDVAAPAGTPIAATGDGVVIFAGVRGGYGNTVLVDHGGGITSLYAHMSQIGVSVGTVVRGGDGVGLVGATGTATGNHLHFEIRLNGGPVDPTPYLP